MNIKLGVGHNKTESKSIKNLLKQQSPLSNAPNSPKYQIITSHSKNNLS